MPNTVQNDPAFNSLFKTPQLMATSMNQFFAAGSLIQFRYSFWQHDPAPLLIVHVGPDPKGMFMGKIRGVNLHYLTYNVISDILHDVCMTKNFNYANYKGRDYISGAFRTYKLNGVSQVKKLDSEILLRIISGVQSIDPSQVQAIQQSVEDQLRRPTNPVVNTGQDDQSIATGQNVPTVAQTPVIGQGQPNQGQNNQG